MCGVEGLRTPHTSTHTYLFPPHLHPLWLNTPPTVVPVTPPTVFCPDHASNSFVPTLYPTPSQPELIPGLLLPLVTQYSRHHPGTGSYILLASQVILHAGPTWRPALLPQLLTAISPWLTCHTHNVR